MTILNNNLAVPGLPPMTLSQAVDLANRVSAIQMTLVQAMERGGRDELLDHACHAYKALILMFSHANEIERALEDCAMLLDNSRRMMLALRESELWPAIERLLQRPETVPETPDLSA